jgi:hypothetical protein
MALTGLAWQGYYLDRRKTETDAELRLRLGGHNLGLGPGIERMLYATATQTSVMSIWTEQQAIDGVAGAS